MKQAAKTGDTSVIKASASQINTIAEKIRNPDRQPSRIESGLGTMGEIHQARKELREARAEYKAEIAEDRTSFQTTRARATANHQDYFQHNGQLYAVGTRYEAVLGRSTGDVAGNSSQTPASRNPGTKEGSYDPDPDKYGHQNQVDPPGHPAVEGMKDAAKSLGKTIGGPFADVVDDTVDARDERTQNDRIAKLEDRITELTASLNDSQGTRDDGAGAHPGNSDGTNGDGWE